MTLTVRLSRFEILVFLLNARMVQLLYLDSDSGLGVATFCKWFCYNESKRNRASQHRRASLILAYGYGICIQKVHVNSTTPLGSS